MVNKISPRTFGIAPKQVRFCQRFSLLLTSYFPYIAPKHFFPNFSQVIDIWRKKVFLLIYKLSFFSTDSGRMTLLAHEPLAPRSTSILAAILLCHAYLLSHLDNKHW